MTNVQRSRVSGADQPAPPYRDAALPVEARIDDLLQRMTLEDKVMQLRADIGRPDKLYRRTDRGVEMGDSLVRLLSDPPVGNIGLLLRADPFIGVDPEAALRPEECADLVNQMHRFVREHTRLGIPVTIGNDNSRCHEGMQATIFPAVRNMGCAWDRDLNRRVARAIAAESRSRGETLNFAPDLDVIRDPRLGRSEENYGEDPYLVGELGVQFVRGLQGDDLRSDRTMAALLRCYPGAGDFDGGLDFSDVSRGSHDFEEVGLWPWREAVRAGAQAVMVEFATYDRVPAAASRHLLTELLRERWGFDGFTMTDSWAVRFIIQCRVAGDRVQAAALALRAGTDQASPDGVMDERDDGDGTLTMYGVLPEALDAGLIEQEDIDRAVRRVLRVKFRLGLFDDPSVDRVAASSASRSTAHLELAHESARAGIVLLKNDRDTLPLRAGLRNIAVVGPNAHDELAQLGDLSPPHPPETVTTILQGIERLAPEGTRVRHARGCGIRSLDRSGLAAAVETARNADVVIAVVGGSSAAEHVEVNGEWSGRRSPEADCGESSDRATLDLLGLQLELLAALRETGVPLVVVLVHGRTMTIEWIAEHADAIVDAGYPGEAGGTAVAEVLYGLHNPGGRLTVSVPRHVGQIPVHYYRWIRKGRPGYVDLPTGPRYPFGHGLSYTRFEYANLRVEPAVIAPDQTATVSVDVTNRGAVAGDEVVQLYIRDEVSSVARPYKLLRGFQRLRLQPGQTGTARMPLGPRELSFHGPDGEWIVEPGEFTVMIGRDAEHDLLTAPLTVRDG